MTKQNNQVNSPTAINIWNLQILLNLKAITSKQRGREHNQNLKYLQGGKKDDNSFLFFDSTIR